MDVVSPESVEDVVSALQTPGARIVAGGTDILPNLKHRLDEPPKLVSLSRVRALKTLDEADGFLRIGAGLTLTQVSQAERVRELFPSLAHAAGVVASPLIRNMGTLGGNVNLDTRCRYVNQTQFWRTAIGGCLKSEGSVCYVVPKGRNCVAAMSSDCVPVLISLDATVVLVGPGGRRELPVAEYFTADGTDHTLREDGEVTTAIRVPLPAGPRRSSYQKWTVRGSIDFPLLSLALRVDLDRDAADGVITGQRVVGGVLGAKPRVVGKLDDMVGKALNDPDVASLVAETIHRQCKPLPNVPYEAPYRRKMLKVYARRAMAEMVSG
jgi:4-hydroxybenzoyl-CoA reductase subunit beta